jgi:hypothetical protein
MHGVHNFPEIKFHLIFNYISYILNLRNISLFESQISNHILNLGQHRGFFRREKNMNLT